jgi:hypothetical protein
MAKLNLSIFLMTLAALSGGVVQAGGGDNVNPNTPSLSWDQFKDSCLHPEQFNNQVAPKDIKIQCTDVSREFLSSAPGQVPLPGNRRVIFAVYSNKYHVNAEQVEAPILNKGGSCLRFREVERTITVEKRLTCDDILGIKSSLAEFCASNLTLAKGANPKLIENHDTGRFIDTCGGSGAISDGGKKPNS